MDENADQLLVDSPLVRAFVEAVRGIVSSRLEPAEALALIRPRFAELLAADGWLPTPFQQPAPESGMGGGIGQWLLYRVDLLTNDTCYVWRYAYDPATGAASPLRSGYVDVDCD